MKSGWVTKKLGEVCDALTSQLRQKDLQPDSGEYPVYGASGFITKVGFYQSNTNCVGLVKDGAGVGRVMLLPPFSSVIGTMLMLVPRATILNQYFYYLLVFLELGKDYSGATIPHVYFKDFKDKDICLPPLSEQKRIVAKIDAAFEKIDQLKANAEKNLAKAKELFQSALDEAMRPKKGWVEKRLGEIGSVCMCKRILKSETNTERGVPFYKIGTFGKTANAYISQETFDRYRKLYKFPRKGEILISAAGTIGRAVTYDGAPAYFQDSNIVWVANDEKEVLNQYLKWFYATSPWHVTKGATIQRLYNDNIESAQIAYPDICTQKQICQTLEISSQKTETLQQNYAQQIADCAEMRQAILREAFEGRL